MSFKQFLATLNSDASKETVTADVATQKYTEYKNNFRREQIIKFFAAHKNEEWFKCRYHPKISTKRKEEQRESIKRRLDLFMSLLDRYGGGDAERPLSLDMTDLANCTCLYKFLDAAMVRLEGGSDADLALVEELYSTLQDGCGGGGEAEQNGDEVKNANLSDTESGVGSDDEAKEPPPPSSSAVAKEEQEPETAAPSVEVKVEGQGQLDVVETIVDQEAAVSEELESMSRREDEEPTSEQKVANLVSRLAHINKLQQHLQKLNAISAKIPQKTQSIFFKHLPVIVNRSDLEEVSLGGH